MQKELSPTSKALWEIGLAALSLAWKIGSWNRSLAGVDLPRYLRRPRDLPSVVEGLFDAAELLDARLGDAGSTVAGWPVIDRAAAAGWEVCEEVRAMSDLLSEKKFPASTALTYAGRAAALDQWEQAVARGRPAGVASLTGKIRRALARFYVSLRAAPGAYWPRERMLILVRDVRKARKCLVGKIRRWEKFARAPMRDRRASVEDVLSKSRAVLDLLFRPLGILDPYAPRRGYRWWGPTKQGRAAVLHYIPPKHRCAGPLMWPKGRWVELEMGSTERFAALEDGLRRDLEDIFWIVGHFTSGRHQRGLSDERPEPSDPPPTLPIWMHDRRPREDGDPPPKKE